MKVSNNKCIRRLGIRSMRAAKSRNIITILAIALTTLLFTSLFTIALSIIHSSEQANFRQAGGYAHGTFKNITWRQALELKEDPLIMEYGMRLYTGSPYDAPFNKAHAEVSYCDENAAKWMFLDPAEGRLPAEGTNEAATDTRVLSLLGIEPAPGTEFTLTFDVDGQETTEVFKLSGWWEYDSGIVASHILIPQSRAAEIFKRLGTQGKDGLTGFWYMDIMLPNAMNIDRDISKILANQGFQNENRQDDSYIATGVNWGYAGAKLSDSIDPITALAVTTLLLVIVFTGYLIIYNIFQISVSNDVRFFGLLKTIGTTGRQIKRIIRIQALSLSGFGIPIGLFAGYLIGARLTPVVLSLLSGVTPDTVSVSPFIFLLAALFSLVTVMSSCSRPGRIAAKVSPIEAVRYTEAGGGKKTSRKSKKSVSLSNMAFANLGRNRGKTVVTIVSLSMAVVLLNLTFTFTNGFDMDKYLGRMAADFMLADAGYFQVGGGLWNEGMAVSSDAVEGLANRPGIIGGGRTYGLLSSVQDFVAEDYFRSKWGRYYSPDALDWRVNYSEKVDGRLAAGVHLYGMERFVLDKLSVVEGDISKLHESGGRYIAAVYCTDDYGNVINDSHWARVGEMITLRYVDKWEYYDPDTGEIFDDIPENNYYRIRAKVYRDVEYEVAVEVTIPFALTYRFYGSDEFVLNDQTFMQDAGTDAVMYYACDISDEEDADTEAWLRDYTEKIQPQYGYESKATCAAEFESFRNMFTIMGGVLCFIIALVGILNFLNAMLTSIIARRIEFAVLQAIGMTGKQLRGMLIWEGIYHSLGSVFVSLLLCLALSPLLSSALGSVFWFFSYQFTIIPVLLTIPAFALLGVLLPLISYRYMVSHSVVERLRAAD